MGREWDLAANYQQARDFSGGIEASIAHIQSLTIGDTEFEALSKLRDPEDPENTEPEGVVCALSSIYWNGGLTDPIEFSGVLEKKNKTLFDQTLRQKKGSYIVEICFTYWQYESDEGEIFKRFHTNDEVLKGHIVKPPGGGELAMHIDEEASYSAPSGWGFTISVAPDTKEAMVIHTAYEPEANDTEPWGVVTAE